MHELSTACLQTASICEHLARAISPSGTEPIINCISRLDTFHFTPTHTSFLKWRKSFSRHFGNILCWLFVSYNHFRKRSISNRRMAVIDGIPTAGYSLWFIVICLVVFFSIALAVNNVIYNLYQHPLHEIPGPKIAGATYLYQTYYSLRGTSTYYKRIREMHAQYGMFHKNLG